MAEVDIEWAIQELNRVFHCEADIQHELAWKLRQQLMAYLDAHEEGQGSVGNDI